MPWLELLYAESEKAEAGAQLREIHSLVVAIGAAVSTKGGGMLKAFQDRLLKIISGKSEPESKADLQKNREGLFSRLLHLGARRK